MFLYDGRVKRRKARRVNVRARRPNLRAQTRYFSIFLFRLSFFFSHAKIYTHTAYSIKTDVVSRTTRAVVFIEVRARRRARVTCVFIFFLSSRTNGVSICSSEIKKKSRGSDVTTIQIQTRCCRRANNDNKGADSVGPRRQKACRVEFNIHVDVFYYSDRKQIKIVFRCFFFEEFSASAPILSRVSRVHVVVYRVVITTVRSRWRRTRNEAFKGRRLDLEKHVRVRGTPRAGSVVTRLRGRKLTCTRRVDPRQIRIGEGRKITDEYLWPGRGQR